MITERDKDLRELEMNQRWDNHKLRLIAIRVEDHGIGKPHDMILRETQLVQDINTKEFFTRYLNGPSLTIVKEIQKVNWEYWSKVQEILWIN